MDVAVEPGKYVIAVSGGVDSVALLHALRQIAGVELVVAHFDHGIRADSALDATHVNQLAEQYGLPYVSERVELGPQASEAIARQARYDFLRRVQAEHRALAIITAHHQDDVLETAFLNVIRGTGRRGLTSLKSNEKMVRPLLNVSKKDITAYALKHKLSWREDTTNHDERYTRNYIRHRLLVKCDPKTRQQLLQNLRELGAINRQLDDLLNAELMAHIYNDKLDAQWLRGLPHDVACEVMASWLRSRNLADFDRPTIERLVMQAKTKAVGKRLAVRRNTYVTVGAEGLALTLAER